MKYVIKISNKLYILPAAQPPIPLRPKSLPLWGKWTLFHNWLLPLVALELAVTFLSGKTSGFCSTDPHSSATSVNKKGFLFYQAKNEYNRSLPLHLLVLHGKILLLYPRQSPPKHVLVSILSPPPQYLLQDPFTHSSWPITSPGLTAEALIESASKII